MKLGLMIGYSGAHLDLPVDLVQQAESLGYDSVWMAEAWGNDACTPLGYLAAVTDRIRLGTAIMQVPARTPANAAMTAMTLDELSGGRFIMGIGMSGPQVVEGLHGAAFGKPLSRLRECMAILRMALNGEKLQFDGEHYVLPRPGGEGKPIRLSQPPRPNLPIYLATLGPKSLQMTGELADGWLGTSFVPEQSHVFLDDLREGAAKAGRSLADIDIQTGGYFEMSDDVERLIAARKPAMAFTLGGMGSAKTNFYNDAYCRAGYEDDAKAVQSLWIDGKRDQAVARVPDEMVLLTNLIGTEEMIRERLRAFRDAGVNTFRLGTGGESWKERTTALEEAVDLIQRETTSW